MKSIYPSMSLLLSLLLSQLIMSSGCEAKSPSYTIAYSSNESGHGEIYLTDNEANSKIKITNFAGGNGYSAWSPDGKKLLLQENTKIRIKLRKQHPDPFL